MERLSLHQRAATARRPSTVNVPELKWYKRGKPKYEAEHAEAVKAAVTTWQGCDLSKKALLDYKPVQYPRHPEKFHSGNFAYKYKHNPTCDMAYLDPQPPPTGKAARVLRMQRKREIKKLEWEDWNADHNMRTRVWIKQLPGNEKKEANAKYGLWTGVTLCVGTEEEEKRKRGMLRDPPEVLNRKFIRQLAKEFPEVVSPIDDAAREMRSTNPLHSAHLVPENLVRPHTSPASSRSENLIAKATRPDGTVSKSRLQSLTRIEGCRPSVFASQYKNVHSAQSITFYDFKDVNKQHYYRRNPEIAPANRQRIKGIS